MMNLIIQSRKSEKLEIKALKLAKVSWMNNLIEI